MSRRSYDDDWGWESSGPIRTDKGIQSRSQRGEFARNWWAKRWIAALERLMDSGRLSRGRSYARHGQVLSIEEQKGGIVAQVQGSRPRPYKVQISLAPLSDAEWEQVFDALAGEALFAAQLLAGEMPANIEEAFAAAGVSLFPSRRDDLDTSCTCPDWANPCKHVAATHYILGDRFDEDPFLLLRLRGRSQEQVMQALRQRRAGTDAEDDEGSPAEEAEEVVPLEQTLAVFWDLDQALEHFPAAIKPPTVEMPLLKRLGDPSLLSGASLQDLLRPAYQAMARAAQKLADE